MFLLTMAGRMLWARKRQTVTLVGTLVVITALLVVLLGVAAGAQASMQKSATGVLSGHLNVGGFLKVRSGKAVPVFNQEDRLREVVAQALPGARLHSRGRGMATVLSRKGKAEVNLVAVEISTDRPVRETLRLRAGSLEALQGGGVVLFAPHAETLGVGVGDPVVVLAKTPLGVENTVDLRVAAIAEPLGFLTATTALVDLNDWRQLYQYQPGVAGTLAVYLPHPSTLEADTAKVRAALEGAGYPLFAQDGAPSLDKLRRVGFQRWTGLRLDVTRWEHEVSFMDWTVSLVSVLVVLLGLLLVGLASFGVMNSFWVAVRDRTALIGTLRATGMRPGQVARLLLYEAFYLAGAAALGGALLGGALIAGLNAMNIPVPPGAQLFVVQGVLSLALDPSGAGTLVAAVVASALVAALIPSVIASRIRPIVAMNHPE